MTVAQLTLIWAITNVVAIAVTFSSLLDARQNQNAIRLLDAADPVVSRSRAITTSADVRREVLRITMAALMLAAVFPQVTLLALMLVPVSLCVTCLFDARDRRRLTVITAAEIVVERDSAIKELLKAIKENTVISQGARDDAKLAADVANHINDKLEANRETMVAQGAQIVAQGERQERRDAAADKLKVVADSTAEKVDDIHDATVPGEAGA